MTPLAWIVGLVLPACGYSGVQGLPTPQWMDTAHIVRPSSPNTSLAAPAGFDPTPDIPTPPYKAAPDRLFIVVRQAAASQPRTYEAAVFPDRLQAHYVARTALLNFPDLVTAQVQPNGAGGSTLILYSRSVYGYGDLGVNHRRVVAWLTAIDSHFPSSER
ncbi:MAG TPA: DUF1499 domain-containing protein [Rhodopila sp.]|nr:DUF1499 domain-containing protein [Rhodopila sp.]